MPSARWAVARAFALFVTLAFPPWAATPQKVEARFVKHAIKVTTYCGGDRIEQAWEDTTRLTSILGVARSCAGGDTTLQSIKFLQWSGTFPVTLRTLSADPIYDVAPVTLASMDGTVTNSKDSDSYLLGSIAPSIIDQPPDGQTAANGNCPEVSVNLKPLPAKSSVPVHLVQSVCERSKQPDTSISNDESGARMTALYTYFSLGGLQGTGLIGVEVMTYYRLASKFDLSVDHIEVVQAVQTPGNEVPVVAGKKTVARVFVKIGDGPATPVSPVTAVLRGYRLGKLLPELPRASNGPIVGYNVSNREEVNHSLNFVLPQAWTTEGIITLEASLNEDNALYEDQKGNNKGRTEVSFGPAPELSVAYIRVCVPGPPTCPSGAISNATMRRFVERTYPVAGDKFRYRSLGVSWNWPGPMTRAKEADFLATLQKRFALMESVNGSSADQLVAWVPPGSAADLGMSAPLWGGSTKIGRVVFCTDTSSSALPKWPGGNPAVTQVDPIDPVFTLAHELGHNFGLRHPSTTDGCGAGDDKTDWPYASAKLDEVGFDTVEMKTKPRSKFDLMSYCSPPADNIWISRFSYEKLLRGQFLPAAAKTGAGARLASASAFVILSGWAAQDGSAGQLDPAYRLQSQTPAQPSTVGGNHCLRFSSAGGPIADYCFQLDFTDQRTGEPLDRESFALKAPWPEGTVRVELMRGENVLATLSGGASTLALSILSPQPGDKWSGRNTITWSGSDPDGQRLTYSVLYSPDNGGEWLPLHTDTTDTQVAIDAAELESTAEVLIRVLASNGLSSTTATAGPIEVLAVPRMEAGPAVLDFGAVAVKDTSELKVLVENRGNAVLTVASAGSDQAAFVVSGAPVQIPAREVRELQVRFSPASPGEVRGTLTVGGDDADNPSATVSVVGVGTTPQISASADRLDFGSVAEGQNKTLTLTLANRGDGPLTIKGLATGDAQFTVVGPDLPFSIGAGAQQEIAVVFTAFSAAAQQSTLSISSADAAKPTLSVALISSEPGAAAVINTSPGALDFGAVDLNKTKDMTVTVANTGSTVLNVTALTVDNARFTVVSPAAPFTVAAGASQSVVVRFAPATAGTQGGTLKISSNAAASPSVAVALSGTGSAPQQGAPAIDITPATLDFGDVEKGKTKDSTFTVSNSGGGSLNVTSLAIDNARFTVVSTTVPFSLAAASKQVVTVRFAPNAEGKQSGVLVVASNDANRRSAFVPLAGTGTAAATGATPQIQVSATSIDFGTVRTAATADKTISVSNTGGGTLTVSSVEVSGGPFTLVSPAVPFPVAGGAQQAVTVRFAPTAAGTFTGTLTILSNDATKGSLTLALSGVAATGGTTGNAMIDVTPKTLAFGPVLTGTKKALTEMISAAAGTASLTVNSLTIDNPKFTFSAPPTPFIVAFGGQAPITVTFSPDAAGAQTATLTIKSNASNQPTATVALTATGVAPGDYTLAVDDGGFETAVGYDTAGGERGVPPTVDAAGLSGDAEGRTHLVDGRRGRHPVEQRAGNLRSASTRRPGVAQRPGDVDHGEDGAGGARRAMGGVCGAAAADHHFG